jgi:hypothetical protein
MVGSAHPPGSSRSDNLHWNALWRLCHWGNIQAEPGGHQVYALPNRVFQLQGQELVSLGGELHG